MTIPEVRLFHIEVSNMCNFRCGFCPITVTRRKPHSMPLDVFERIVDQISDNRLSNLITLHVLGEPLLYADILNAVRYASDRQLKVNITTNGSLLNEKLIRALNNSGLYSMDISLQLFGNHRHASRHAGMSFQEYYSHVLRSVHMIRNNTDIQLIVKVMNTISWPLFSMGRPSGFVQQGREFRGLVQKIIMDINQELGSDLRDREVAERIKSVNLNSAVRIRIDEKFFVFVQLFMDWGNAFCEKKVYPVKFGSCSFAFRTPAVLSNGSVVICGADYDGHTSLGHIDDGPLTSIFSSERAHELWDGFKKNKLKHPYCRQCFGSSSRFLAWGKGLGSILASRFLKLQGENRVMIR